MSKSTHGGAREGAGRPKSPSKMVRVPVGFYDEVKALIDAYRKGQPVVVFDGHEAFMVFNHLKQHSVTWKDCRVVSDSAEASEIASFSGDELLSCMARKGIIKQENNN